MPIGTIFRESWAGAAELVRSIDLITAYLAGSCIEPINIPYTGGYSRTEDLVNGLPTYVRNSMQKKKQFFDYKSLFV